MKAIEQAGNAHGLPYLQMMENAGMAAYAELQKQFPQPGSLLVDTDIWSMYEYFEIFLQWILMCRGAVDMLGATFKLTTNGAKVL